MLLPCIQRWWNVARPVEVAFASPGWIETQHLRPINVPSRLAIIVKETLVRTTFPSPNIVAFLGRLYNHLLLGIYPKALVSITLFFSPAP